MRCGERTVRLASCSATQPGEPGAARSPVAGDPAVGERGAGPSVAGVSGDLCAGRTAVDAPERLLRALLLQALFTVRSERQLMQQITYNMLFRWFVGLAMDVPVWDVTVFTENRDRLLEGDIACGFLAAILADPAVKPLLSTEHFSVDGTLIEAWASMKSFRPKDGSGEPLAPGRNGAREFHGEKRSNETHASTTDPDARLYKKSPGHQPRSATWDTLSWRTATVWWWRPR